MTCDKDCRTYIFYFTLFLIKKNYHVVVSFLESLLVKIKYISYNEVVFFHIKFNYLYKEKKSNLNM